MKSHKRPMIHLSGEAKDDEIELFTVAVGNIDPTNPASVKAMEIISKMNGLAGVQPHFPRGTLVMFFTLADATAAFSELNKMRIATGNNICNCFVSKAVYQAAKEETERIRDKFADGE